MKKLGPCKTCQCFVKKPVLNQGSCVRFPPQMIMGPVPGGGVGIRSEYTAVSIDAMGCFEHIPIEDKFEDGMAQESEKSEQDKLREAFDVE